MPQPRTARMGMRRVHQSWSITCRKARTMQMPLQMQVQVPIRRQAGRLGDEGRTDARVSRDELLLGMELNCRRQQIMNQTARNGGVYELAVMDIVSRCLELHLEGCWPARIGAESPCGQADADAVMGASLSPRLREPLFLAVWSSSDSACIIRHTYLCPGLLEQQLEPHSSLQPSCPSRVVTASPLSRCVLRL